MTLFKPFSSTSSLRPATKRPRYRRSVSSNFRRVRRAAHAACTSLIAAQRSPSARTMPTYSLKHARSGSSNSPASIAPLVRPISPLAPAPFCQTRADFHPVSRAEARDPSHRAGTSRFSSSVQFCTTMKAGAGEVSLPPAPSLIIRNRFPSGETS